MGIKPEKDVVEFVSWCCLRSPPTARPQTIPCYHTNLLDGWEESRAHSGQLCWRKYWEHSGKTYWCTGRTCKLNTERSQPFQEEKVTLIVKCEVHSVITVVLTFMQTAQDESVQRILVWALILWGIRFLMAIFVELTVTKIFLACSHSNCVHLLLRSFLLISHLRERCGWHFADRWQLAAEPGAKVSGCSDEFSSQWWEELYCWVSLHHPWIILHWGGDVGRPEGVKLERKDNELFGQS